MKASEGANLWRLLRCGMELAGLPVSEPRGAARAPTYVMITVAEGHAGVWDATYAGFRMGRPPRDLLI